MLAAVPSFLQTLLKYEQQWGIRYHFLICADNFLLVQTCRLSFLLRVAYYELPSITLGIDVSLTVV